MAKVFLQDVIPSNKRSIRNIPLPAGKSEQSVKEPSSSKGKKPPPPKKPAPNQSSKSRRRFPIHQIWIGAVLVLAALVYAGSFFIVTADVRIIPKQISSPINVSASASLEPAAGELGYTMVTLSKENSREVAATGQEKVERKASGKIIIYNSFSTQPQTLVANTRFATSGGLIFRIKDQVSVPGLKTLNSTQTPGSVTATVYADKPGDQYNVGLADFTIPGFAGDPKHAKIIAKSDPASPIGGGFVGTIMKVLPSDAAAAKVSIEAQLKKELQDELESQIPDSHILFRNASVFNFEELPQISTNSPIATSGNTATIREKGSVTGILFERNALSKFLASWVTDVAGRNVWVSNLDKLNFTLDNLDKYSPVSTNGITFKLTGDATFVWQVDKLAVSTSLVGQKRANIKGILAGFEAVDRAVVSIKPIWIFSLPSKPERISIEIEKPQ